MQPGGQPAGFPQQPLRRPGILTTGVLLASLASLIVIGAQVLTLVTGRKVLTDMIGDATGGLGDILGDSANSLVNPLVDDAFKILQTRGYIDIVVAAIALLCALLSFGGSMAFRVLTTLFLLGAMAFGALFAYADVFPSVGKILMLVALLPGLVGIGMLLFSGSINQYVRAKRLAPRG
jgi:hypothetical protein